ncbi:MAG: aryl-sulfate sulfotransferase [Bacteroidetes bacterium]|nr:aryl-sulfate sulfotransferase [Bacteroidota bacterium]
MKIHFSSGLINRVAIHVGLICVLAFVAGCDSFEGDRFPNSEQERRTGRSLERMDEKPIAYFLSDIPEVSVNPSGIAPLSAEISFETNVSSKVIVDVLGDSPLSWEENDPQTVHRIPLVGLYAGANVARLTFLDEGGRAYSEMEIDVQTEPLPGFFPNIEVVSADRAKMEPGLNWSDFGASAGSEFVSYPIAFDEAGQVRWFFDLSKFGDLAAPIQFLQNGNLLVSFGNQLGEYDLLGRELNSWRIPDWFHHDIIEKPDGNFIVSVDKVGRDTGKDHIIEIDRQSGAVVNEWDIREVLDVSRRDFGGTDEDWFHMNAVWYSEDDDALIVSGRTQGVIKVTKDNELLWILAPHRGWGKAGVDSTGIETSDYLLTAVNDFGVPLGDNVQNGSVRTEGFDWSWGQHAPMLLPNGNLFVFDNGVNRSFTNSPGYSRGVEYHIDEANMTVRQVWAFGRELGVDFYSSIISDVDYLPQTGNRLIMPGIIYNSSDKRAAMAEVTASGELVFYAKIHFKNTNGTGEFVWGQFDLVYRSERAELVPNGLRIVRPPAS